MNEDWSGLNLSELIDLLEPMPQPAQVSLVPQTAGWIWLGAAVLAGIAMLCWWLYRLRKRNAYRRQALTELEACQNDPGELARILRRTALAAYPRAEIASLHGRDWLAFLDRTYPGNAFLEGAGKDLADAPYRQSGSFKHLKPVVSDWIRKHKSEAA
ncbi:DUF4381 domain-containing protein [uncultured Roseibium sp.]|uniref:DUF4381 domain-containing protein n=1 Tax=uncultured Roseibium sp. TaxID=1936171 RepID=UPI0026294A22|nr:DUF4381 domain-containing protein [uncultured Roseibium sp.]